MMKRILSSISIILFLIVLLYPLSAYALPGDLDGSGNVDGFDLIIFALANGSGSGDANWNSEADLDGNGVVNTADLDILSSHFGNNGVSFGLWAGDQVTGSLRVSKLSAKGNQLRRVGDFNTPISISGDLRDGSVWVADNYMDKVVKLNPFDGSTLLTINGMDAYSVSVNSNTGSVWVADYNNNRIIELLPTITDGYTIGTDTGSHKVISGFNRPRSVSVNPQTGVVWVADTYNNRIVRLSSGIPEGYNISTNTGEHVVKTGFYTPYDVSVNVADGTVWIADSNNNQVVKLSSFGTTEIVRTSGYSSPIAVDVNPVDGSVWVADQYNDRIVRLDSNGAVLASAGGFFRPNDVAVNPLDGTCWVADNFNHQVVKLSPNGTELMRLNGFYSPRSVAVVPDAVSSSISPVATTSLSSNNVNVSELITFTGSGTDPDGSIVLYEWDFDGDGVFDYSSTTSGVTTHAYSSTGIYNPVFRVRDNDWLTAADFSQKVRVGTLIAVAGANIYSGTAPLVVSLTASFNDPIDGQIDNYQWDFDGDGIYDFYSETTGNTSHYYNKAGNYTATLKVTDGPHTATDSITIEVIAALPTATASAIPLTGPAPLNVSFNGSGYDPDGTVVLYQWDFDGNGISDWNSTTGGNTTHIFTSSGTFTSTLTVTDNSGFTDSVGVTINVGLMPPVAVANVDVAEGHIPLSVNFNAAGSSAPSGTITLYEWDFESDGTYDYSSAVSGDAAHTYSTSGLITATLRVTDSNANQGMDTIIVNVVPITDPLASAGAAPLTGTAPLTVNFTGTGVDGDGTISEYQWNFGEEYVWVADTTNNQVVRLFQDGSREIVRKGGFSNPYDVSVNPIDGTVWIADNSNSRIVHLTADGRTELARVSGFAYPRSVSVNIADGSVWAANTNGNQVVRLAYDGSELVRVGGFSYPYDVSVNPTDGSVWVTDYYNNQVVKLSSTGTELSRTGGFYYPESVSVDYSDGSVWIADTSNNQVVKLSSTGTELYRISGFYHPMSVSVDQSNGNVWIADQYNSQVVKLSSTGTELVRKGGFYYPIAVSVNEVDGSVWVADHYNNKVVKLDADGTELARLGGFYYPRGVAVGGTGAANLFNSAITGDTSHTYSVAGIYEAILTVTDNDGKKDTDTVEVRVFGIPAVTALSNISSGQAPLEVFLSGTVVDSDSRISFYEWDPDGDGIYDSKSAVSANLHHLYATAGTYNATLRVTDTDGYNSTDFITINVGQSPPVAVAGAAPLKGNASLNVNLFGSGSDADGTIALYEWDYQSDGTWDFSSASTATTTYAFDTPGNYVATLRVTDDDGLTDMDTVEISVREAGTPSAMIYANPSNGGNPLDVRLCSNGYDPDGTIVQYEWDFDGDGTYDSSSSAPPTSFADDMENGTSKWTADSPWTLVYPDSNSPSYYWSDSPEGDYGNSVNLNVVSMTINLAGSVSPRLVFWHRYDLRSGDYGRVYVSGNNGTSWTNIGSFTNGTVSNWTKQEYDLSSYAGNANVRIRFNLSSNTTEAGDGWDIDDVWVGDCPLHTYSGHGEYTAVLRVTDNDGKQSTASDSISVVESRNIASVWVADRYNNRVVRLSDDGKALARITNFYLPRSLDVNASNGEVWVADTSNDRVVRLSEETPDGYSLNISMVTHDSSPVNSTGILFGNAVSGTGNLNGGIALDGSGDYILIPSSRALDVQSFTVEAWIKPAATNRAVFMRSNDAGTNELLFMYISANTLRAYLDNGLAINFTGTANIGDGVWHHVALVYDAVAGELRCYLDGALYGTPFSTSVSLDFGSSNAAIGADYNHTNLNAASYFSGAIDDVRLWNTARTISDIANNKDSELTGSEAGLVGYWKLNTTQGTPYHTISTGFNDPYDVSVDSSDGSVWVADYYNNQVVKLSSTGTELLRLSGYYYPYSVSVNQSDSSVWVADYYHSQLVKLSPSGTELVRKSGFYTPVDVSAIETDGGAWVADYGAGEVVRLSSDGTELLRISGFNYPSSLSLNSSDGSVWVSDAINNQVVKLLSTGSEILRISGFSGPLGIDINSGNGTVWVANTNQNQVVKLTTGGAELLRIGGFFSPNDVVVDLPHRKLIQPPVASVGANPTAGDIPLTVTFTGSGTDNGSIVRYEWDFDGDGTLDFTSPSSGNTAYTYSQPGTYNPIFRVTDDDGMMDYDSSLTIYVGPLTVYPTVSPLTGNAPLTVTFSGTVRGLAEGAGIVLYEWDFNGDGVYDWSSPSTMRYIHTYQKGAAYNAIIRVTDNYGNRAYGSLEVVVNKTAPTGYNNASPLSGFAPLLVTLTGSGYDPDGSVVLYEWDYNGDGIFDWFSTTSAQTLFTYSIPGTYNAVLRITDNDGLSSSLGRSITVNERQIPPTAEVSADAIEGIIPLAVNFVGSGNDPDDGTITLYEWDFDGDGVYESSSASSGNASYTYNASGQYTAVLRVTDADGLTATASITILAKSAGTPTAVANASPLAGDVPLTVNFNSTGSTDPDGNIVRYDWNFGDEMLWVVNYGDDTVVSLRGSVRQSKLIGFINPLFIDVDNRDGTAWLTDNLNNQVVKLKSDGSGEIIRVGGFNRPEGISVNQTDGTVWIADRYNHQIVNLASDGSRELARVSGFNSPTSVSVYDGDGSVWVANYNASQIVRLDSDGNEQARIGGFYFPYWVSANQADGSVWVADRSNNRVVKLTGDVPDGYNTSVSLVAEDTTVNNNKGLLFGNAAAATGNLDGGVSLDGNGDYILIPNSPALDVQSFTIEAWIKPMATNRAIYMRGNSTGGNELLLMYYNTSTLRAYLDDGSVISFTGAATLGNGQWHHVALVYDSVAGELRCYVDGALYGTPVTISAVLDFGGSHALIGADFDQFNAGLGDYYSGVIDDVRLWNVSRSASEIAGGKDSELTGAETGLAGYWKMNAVPGTPYHKMRTGFNQPYCAEVNPNDGTAWVCDYNNGRMVKVSEDLSREIISVGGFTRPRAAVVNPNDDSVWVVEYGPNLNDVARLSGEGKELQRISGFSSPNALALYNPLSNQFSSALNGTTSHTYNVMGIYNATLTVTDNDGLTDRDSVIIKAGRFPVSIPMAYPTSGDAPLSVLFSANGSSPDGTIEWYYWDHGDGSPAWSNPISAPHEYTYPYPGTFIASQTVVDNRGLSDTRSITITVGAGDTDPVAEGFASPSEGNSPLDVTLTGLGKDTNGFITQYEWDYENDGIYDYVSSTNGLTTHTYSGEGIYTAVLRVTDNDGATGTANVIVDVKLPGSPRASASATPVNGVAALNVSFTGSGTDDGSIVKYEWDFNGDGAYDWSSMTTGNTNYSYATPGSYNAVLRVTDNAGLTDTDSVNIAVSIGVSASLSQDLLDPSSGGTVLINSVLTGDAIITVRIKDKAGNIVRTLANNVSRSAGYYSDAWDGRDDDGFIVNDGVYLFIIEYNAGGINYVYDVTNNVSTARFTPGVTYPASFNPFDSQTNFFRYTLSKKSEVTIYVAPFVSGAGQRIKTLLVREPMKAGSYVQVWDGTDDSGNLVPYSTYVIAVMGWELPANAIIINTRPVISDLLVAPTYLNPDAQPYDDQNISTFTYTLSKAADVVASIVDEDNNPIRTIVMNGVSPGSGKTIIWDGKNGIGSYVAPGIYRLKLVAAADGHSSLEANALISIFY